MIDTSSSPRANSPIEVGRSSSQSVWPLEWPRLVCTCVLASIVVTTSSIVMNTEHDKTEVRAPTSNKISYVQEYSLTHSHWASPSHQQTSTSILHQITTLHLPKHPRCTASLPPPQKRSRSRFAATAPSTPKLELLPSPGSGCSPLSTDAARQRRSAAGCSDG